MKRVLFVLIAATLLINVHGQDDQALIRQVIMSAYVDGIHNHGDAAEIDKGFHPCFVLLGIGADSTTVTLLPIYNWKESTRAAKAKAMGVKPPVTECKFISIDVTGNAAMAKIELWRGNKLIFTDYLGLYKFREGWRIVNKIYYRH